MLTPAEELGLAGLALASRVQHALYRLAPAELAGLIERLREGALAAALADPADRWVVQQLATIPVREFPVIGPDGAVHIEPFYTVMGFAASEHGVAILARASQKQVVNVAQHGGICGVLVSHSRPAIGAGSWGSESP
jgi:hypothetical protein